VKEESSAEKLLKSILEARNCGSPGGDQSEDAAPAEEVLPHGKSSPSRRNSRSVVNEILQEVIVHQEETPR